MKIWRWWEYLSLNMWKAFCWAYKRFQDLWCSRESQKGLKVVKDRRFVLSRSYRILWGFWGRWSILEKKFQFSSNRKNLKYDEKIEIKSWNFFFQLQSDFYLFDIFRKSWILICEDTSLENGPQVVTDHQVCISHELRTIYIFGGKLTNRWTRHFSGRDIFLIEFLDWCDRSEDSAEYYSDFYAYHINTNTWNKLYVDISHPLAANPDIQSVKSRVNHSILYDDVSRKCYLKFNWKNNFLPAEKSKNLHFRRSKRQGKLCRFSQIWCRF